MKQKLTDNLTQHPDQNMTEEKKNLRKQILSLRNQMPMPLREKKSRRIEQKLYRTEVYRKADVLLTYVDYQSEVITTPIINHALEEGKQVFAPKVMGEEMEFCQIRNLDALTEGYRGIREPVSGRVFRVSDEEWKAHNLLMLIPGVVFDTARHRIGYGKGFYDRYLHRLAENRITISTIALCYECQVLQSVPYEKHDIRPDRILTENRILCFIPLR